MNDYILLFVDEVLAYGEFFTLLNLADEHAMKNIPGMKSYIDWKNLPCGRKDWAHFKPGDLITRSECDQEDPTVRIRGFYSIWSLPSRSEDPESYEYYTHK